MAIHSSNKSARQRFVFLVAEQEVAFFVSQFPHRGASMMDALSRQSRCVPAMSQCLIFTNEHMANNNSEPDFFPPCHFRWLAGSSQLETTPHPLLSLCKRGDSSEIRRFYAKMPQLTIKLRMFVGSNTKCGPCIKRTKRTLDETYSY